MGHSKHPTVVQQNSTLRNIIYSIAAAVLGAGLLYISSFPYFHSHSSLQALIQNLGGVIFASVALSMAWELRGKRHFLSEILEKTKLSSDIHNAGVVRIYRDTFQIPPEDWSDYIQSSSNIELCFDYGNIWRNINSTTLRQIGDSHVTSMRVIIPNPASNEATSVLAKRFHKTPETIASKINDTIAFFNNLQADLRNEKRKIEISIHMIPFAPNYHLYRFDRQLIFCSYSHRKNRPAYPGIVCKTGGTLYEYYKGELENLVAISKLHSENNTRVVSSTAYQNDQHTAMDLPHH